ncbi:hypothetical protein SNEBB_006107 [Seison nebaliae]|nr:hypothetical protein SNEBB_006107 [Seison nebaliae]
MSGTERIVEFPYKDLSDKRELLNSLNIRHRNPEDVVLQGCNNPTRCGVCLPNAVFALIISSNLLMAEIRNMETKDSVFIRNFMHNVKRDPYIENRRPLLPLITAGDLLRDKFMTTKERRFSPPTTFGFAGEYYLLKSYLETVCLNRRSRPIPSGDIVESCCHEIREQKVMGFPYKAWERILKDLFHPRQSTEEIFKFQGLEATYYNEIDFLSIFWLEDHESILNYNRLPLNFLHMMDRSVTQQLRNYMENNNLEPKHIAINSETLLTKELHPLTYQNFFECLEQLNGNTRQVNRFFCENLEIVYDRRGEKLPLNFNQTNLEHIFHYEARELLYRVTGITFVSIDVEENRVNVDLMLGRHRLRVINLDKAEIRQCEANMFSNLMDYLTIVKRRLDLVALARTLENDLRDFMQNICFYQHENFPIPFDPSMVPCHFFSVTRKDNHWIILNDDIVINIEDEQVFWSVFKFEHVVSILLERTEKP